MIVIATMGMVTMGLISYYSVLVISLGKRL